MGKVTNRIRRKTMFNWQKFIATGLAACMLVLPFGDLAVSLQAKAPKEPTALKQKVELLGVGANVKVQPKNGPQLRGSISAIEDNGFRLGSKGTASPEFVSYDQVSFLEYIHGSYKAAGQPDPVEARRVIAGHGIGQRLTLTLSGSPALTGRTQVVDQEHFTFLPDHQSQPVQISYTDLQHAKRKGFPLWAGIAIAGGIAGVVLGVGAYLLSRGD
jgi:hypothetical protein